MTSTAELSFEFLVNTFDSIAEAVVLADLDRKIIAVNEAFTHVFGYASEEAIGNKTAFIYASEDRFELAGRNTFYAGSNASAKLYEIEYARKNGEQFLGETVASEVKNDDGEPIGFLGIIRDLTHEKRRNTELQLLSSRLQALVEITTKGVDSFDGQVQQILEVTTRLLQLDVGIVSEIRDEIYTVKYFYPESSGLYKEQSFRLGNTYCDLTFEQDDIVAIHNMEESVYNAHPCYQHFELEGYVGIPYNIAGERAGTINFSSQAPPKNPFRKADLDLLRIIAQWVGVLLHRKRIKEELIQSRDIYRIVSERASDIVCLLSPDGSAEYVSPSVKNILGYEQEEFLQTHLMNLVHPADIGKASGFFDTQVFKKKKTDTMSFQVKKRDGSFIWLENTYEVINDQKNHVLGVKLYSRDVTDAKKLERIYEQVEGIGKIGGWEFNLITEEIYWTGEVYNIIGSKKAVAFHSEDGLKLFSEKEDQQTVYTAIRKSIDLGVTTTIDIPFTSVFGTFKYLRFKTSAHLEKKVAIRVYGTVQDITEKKREENLFNDTQEMAQVGGWELELETQKLYWTEEVYRIHEVESGAALKVEEGINFYDVEDGSRDTISNVVQKAIDHGVAWDVVLTIITGLGNKKLVRSIGKTVIRKGKVVKLYGTFQDVTTEKQKEKELEQKNIELAELNTMSHQMNSIIGHDLKSPLSSIIGLSDFTLYSLNGPEENIKLDDIRTNLKMMYVASRKMAELLDDVFKWSRLQIVGIELNLEKFRLNSIVESTFEILDLVATEKNIELINVCDNDIYVVADRTLCPTIIRNFISNAIKFSTEGGAVTVSCAQTESYWSVSVRDEGVGMPDEVKNNLFHSIKHPSKRGTRNEKGTGIGLRLSQKLAQLHDGEILVESELGNGSLFTFKAPLVEPTI